jgi:anti-anti-sigma factor
MADVTILAFTGEFDAAGFTRLGEKIDTLIQKGCTHLVFNLRSLKFVDSTALVYLIKTHRRLKELDGELVLSEPSKFFRTTIKALALDQVFRICPNDQEAVKYFRDDDHDGTAGVPARLHPHRPSGSGAAPPPEEDRA